VEPKLSVPTKEKIKLFIKLLAEDYGREYARSLAGFKMNLEWRLVKDRKDIQWAMWENKRRRNKAKRHVSHAQR
jgi:hypothetical protein